MKNRFILHQKYSYLFFIAGLIFAISGGVLSAKSAPVNNSDDFPKSVEAYPADNLISLDARKAAFKIVQGEGEGKIVPMEVKAAADEKEWALTFENLYRLFLFRNSDGAVQVDRMELLERNERIRFEPAFVLIPDSLKAGIRIRQTGRVEVIDMETGEASYDGSYTEILKEMSRADFDTPAGTISGYLVEYEFQINLDYAVIRLDLESGWSEDQRLVHWRTKRTIEKFGLFGDTTYRSLALADTGKDN